MTRLFDICDVIRSKNSGPYELTFDLIFSSFEAYESAKATDFFTKDLVASLYSIRSEDVICIINFDPAKAIKITIVRPIPSGDLGETDVYGAQQHAPFLNLELPM